MTQLKCICGLIMLLAGSIQGPLGAGQDSSFLSGSWRGYRDGLSERGLEIELVLTSELVQNVQGGLRRDRGFLGNVDLTMTLDTEKAGWWSRGTLFAYVLGNFQADLLPTELVGDIQATSNIEAPQTLKLYEIWYSHSFLADRISLLVGLHDYNSEFDALEVAGAFRHSSFGISPDISQVGPSIFPTTALAARLRLQPSESSYVLAAIYDGVPGDPDNERDTRILLQSDDGLFYALEAGFSLGDPELRTGYAKAALGGWLASREVDDFEGRPRQGNYGLYLIGERSLFAEENDNHQGLSAFLQLGLADRQRNEIGTYAGAGITYTGLLPKRPDDVLGLAVGSARFSSGFRGKNPEFDHHETAIELTYQATLLPWLLVQPDVQYILNPGSEANLDDSLQLGLSWQISF